VVGCAVGFLAGFFGVGGGILMVPVLVFNYERSGVSWLVLTHIAFGTSLFVIIFASLTSAYQHGKQRNIDWRSVFVIGFSSAVTALATTKLAAWLSGRHLRIAFGLLVMATAIKMLTESEAKAQRNWSSHQDRPSQSCRGRARCWCVASLAGVGGGIVTIPMMYYLLNMPLKLAIGTSSATIVITALFSVVGYILNGMGRDGLPEWSLGFVDLQRVLRSPLGRS